MAESNELHQKRNSAMPSSETIVIALIWGLTAVGLFFSLRALWRRRKG